MSAIQRAYRALQHAAEQVGLNNFRKGLYRPQRIGRKMLGYSITDAHQQLIDAMPQVLSGLVTPEEAMALVTSHDVMQQRFE